MSKINFKSLRRVCINWLDAPSIRMAPFVEITASNGPIYGLPPWCHEAAIAVVTDPVARAVVSTIAKSGDV